MVNFYVTVDRSRLHIANESSHYGGSINSYNNFLTRFFARIFGKMMQVNFHGKLRAVNKTSYEKFLKTNGVIVSANNLHCFKNFNEAMKTQSVCWVQNGSMRDHLSKSKSEKLFSKLVLAIHQDQPEKAQKLAGQGAALEKEFWKREDEILFCNPIYDALTSYKDFSAIKLSPILYAAYKKKFSQNVDLQELFSHLTQFLSHIGANKNYEGEGIEVNFYLENRTWNNLPTCKETSSYQYRHLIKKTHRYSLDENLNLHTHDTRIHQPLGMKQREFSSHSIFFLIDREKSLVGFNS